jgi:mitofilin
MPDRGGCVAYFASALMSPFLFDKAGYTEGNDVMSVLSRAHYFLGKRDLESAAIEINQLKVSFSPGSVFW